MAKGQSLQDPYLNALRRERILFRFISLMGLNYRSNRIIRPIRDFIKKHG